jgi:uncharacterized protein with HEPN domain
MWRDEAFLLDMLLASRRIMKYAHGLDFEQFEEDEVLQDAVMRRIQIIGEAARMISTEFKEGHPEISWPEIIGMRNKLIHEYFRIIPEKVWEAVVKDIPALITLIEPLVPPDQPEKHER